jgi:hypothetical protein
VRNDIFSNAGPASAGGDPELVSDDEHHKNHVDAESPKDAEFGPFEVTAKDGMFLGFDELIVLERGEDEGLFGGEGFGLGFWGHGSMAWLIIG